jgi:hypothetical protein
VPEPETPPAETPPADTQPPAGGDNDDLAGMGADELRRVLERTRSEAAGHRHEAREARERLERLQRQHETEQERRTREAYERGRTEQKADDDRALAGKDREIATMGIRAKAADRFRDPDDAVRLLPLDELLAEPDAGRRDTAVDKAIAGLLEAKPYLGREADRRPLVTQGGRSEPPDGRPRERHWLRGG